MKRLVVTVPDTPINIKIEMNVWFEACNSRFNLFIFCCLILRLNFEDYYPNQTNKNFSFTGEKLEVHGEVVRINFLFPKSFFMKLSNI